MVGWKGRWGLRRVERVDRECIRSIGRGLEWFGEFFPNA